MQEDFVGTVRTLHHDTSLCTLCGAPSPAGHLIPMDADPSDGARSERQEVCPECYRSLVQGDDPAFPLDVDPDLSPQWA